VCVCVCVCIHVCMYYVCKDACVYVRMNLKIFEARVQFFPAVLIEVFRQGHVAMRIGK